MKKASISFITLLAFAALVFTSCGGLTSARNETGSFTFTIDDAMAEQIARTNGSNLTVTVAVHSKDGTTYTPDTQSKSVANVQNSSMSAVKTALTGTSFTFVNMPYNVDMVLKVEIKVDNVIRFSSLTKTFKLTENGSTNIEADIYAALNTPYVLTNSNSVYMVSDDFIQENRTNGVLNLESLDTSFSLANRTNYCFDRDNNLWYIYSANSNSWSINKRLPNNTEVTHTFSPDSTFTNQCQPWSLSYDAETNKICVLVLFLENQSSDVYGVLGQTFDLDDFPETYSFSENNMYHCTKNPFFDSPYQNTTGGSLICATNGCLYSLLTFNHISRTVGDNGASPSITLRKTSLLTGEWLEDTTVTIPRTGLNHNSSYDLSSALYEFNDIYASDDSVYILFHQREVWDQNKNGGNRTVSPDDFPSEIGCIDRGGIIVFDAETMEQRSIIGMPETHSTMDLLLSIKKSTSYGYTYVPAYSNNSLTTPVTISFPIVWSIAEKGSIQLSNPQKIVAIKPKKLVIADGGLFIFDNKYGEELNANGDTKITKESSPEKSSVSSGSRLIEVDLENFSDSSVLASFSGTNGNWYSPVGQYATVFKISYSRELEDDETVYAPKFTLGGPTGCDYLINRSNPTDDTRETFTGTTHSLYADFQFDFTVVLAEQ